MVAINEDEIYRLVTDCSVDAARLEPSNGAVPNSVDLVLRNLLLHAELSRPGENGSTAESTPSEAMTDLNRQVVTPMPDADLDESPPTRRVANETLALGVCCLCFRIRRA